MQPEPTELDSALQQRKAAESVTLDIVRDALRNELMRKGIAQTATGISAEFNHCELRKDVVDGSAAFYGEWWDARGGKIGSVIVHASGQFFAEYDVLIEHPTDCRWFVEAVTAWGRPGVVKAELRLLAALPA